MRNLSTQFIFMAIFGWLFCGTYAAKAQVQAPSAPVSAPIDRDSLDDMLHTLQFDELLTLTSDALAQPTTPKSLWLLHYYRGASFWRLGFLDQAESEMMAISPQDPEGIEIVRTPDWYIKTIERQKLQRPAHSRDVAIDGKVLFTVYYESEDETLKQLLNLLPIAVNSVRRVTGALPRPTVVLIFQDIAKMQAYEDIPRKTPPIPFSLLAHGGTTGVHIAPLRTESTQGTNPRGPYFRLSVTHEYLHVIVARILEAHRGLPVWLSEGMANVTGCQSAPMEEGLFADEFRDAVAKKAVLSYEEISGPDFYRISEEEFNNKTFKDPYAQATEMAEYLLLGRPASIFAVFLKNLKESDDFDIAFKKTFNESPQDFYKDWYAYAVH